MEGGSIYRRVPKSILKIPILLKTRVLKVGVGVHLLEIDVKISTSIPLK